MPHACPTPINSLLRCNSSTCRHATPTTSYQYIQNGFFHEADAVIVSFFWSVFTSQVPKGVNLIVEYHSPFGQFCFAKKRYCTPIIAACVRKQHVHFAKKEVLYPNYRSMCQQAAHTFRQTEVLYPHCLSQHVSASSTDRRYSPVQLITPSRISG